MRTVSTSEFLERSYQLLGTIIEEDAVHAVKAVRTVAKRRRPCVILKQEFWSFVILPSQIPNGRPTWCETGIYLKSLKQTTSQHVGWAWMLQFRVWQNCMWLFNFHCTTYVPAVCLPVLCNIFRCIGLANLPEHQPNLNLYSFNQRLRESINPMVVSLHSDWRISYWNSLGSWKPLRAELTVIV